MAGTGGLWQNDAEEDIKSAGGREERDRSAMIDVMIANRTATDGFDLAT
jgi:hypothetical protein